MKTNRTILKTSLSLAIIGWLMILGVSCSDFLDRKPLGRYTEDEIPLGSFDGRVFGLYANLRAFGVSALAYAAIHNFRSDDADKGSTLTDGAAQGAFYDDFNYTTDEWLLNSYWTDHYVGINNANSIISDIDSAGIDTDSMTIVNMAEARFIRAYLYFDMVRTYGEVPLIDFKVISPEDANVPKAPVEEIFTLIDEDLDFAMENLPKAWQPLYIGRATWGAATALKAKTYLWRSNWDEVLRLSGEIITSGRYSLAPDYEHIFRESGENNEESIFEIQAVYTPAITNLGSDYAMNQGVRGAGPWNLGWGWNTPSKSLADEYETGDPRMDATLLFAGRVNAPYGENVPPKTADAPRDYWNKKVYTDPRVREEAGSQVGQWMNVRIIRYADVLLWAAEAANELGQAQNALEYLELVRARARGDAEGILPKVRATGRNQLRTAIRHERRVELGMENERFFDLIRWQTVETTMRAAGKTGYQARHKYLPIPQPEIDKSDGVLEQNPDY